MDIEKSIDSDAQQHNEEEEEEEEEKDDEESDEHNSSNEKATDSEHKEEEVDDEESEEINTLKQKDDGGDESDEDNSLHDEDHTGNGGDNSDDDDNQSVADKDSEVANIITTMKKQNDPSVQKSKRNFVENPADEAIQVATPVKKRKKLESTTTNKPFNRVWGFEDEITLLKGMLKFDSETGNDKSNFFNFIKNKLQFDCKEKQLNDKLNKLRKKFRRNCSKTKSNRISSPHEDIIFKLSKKVWGDDTAQLIDICDEVASNKEKQFLENVSHGSIRLTNSNPVEELLKDMWESLTDSQKSKIAKLLLKRKMSEIQLYNEKQKIEAQWSSGVLQVLNAP